MADNNQTTRLLHFGSVGVDEGERGARSDLARTRKVLERIFGPPVERSFSVRLWDGTTDAPPHGREPEFTLVLRHPGALRAAFLPPTDRRMGEAFVRGHIDIEGDVEAAGAVAATLKERAAGPLGFLGLVGDALKLPRGNRGGDEESTPTPGPRRATGARRSRARDAASVRYHYDVGNRFFEIFLDSRLAYSCGYFARGDETLDEAQEAKLDLICRKLRLREGDKFLDIGCGWGSLVTFAAERYGVRATGITLSVPQAEVARRRVAEAGLADRCRIEVVDYRDLDGAEPFAKIASVGMVEHVGRAKLPTYFGQVERSLEPGGLFLNHGIVALEPDGGGLRRRARRWLARRNSFIQSFVFPDSELVSPAEVIRPGELVGLELRDVESLREHYAATLRHWVRRLEAGRDRAVLEAGEQTYRVWRLYMAASAHAFASGRIGIVQALWGKPQADGRLPLPATREDLYRGSEEHGISFGRPARAGSVPQKRVASAERRHG